MKPLDIGRAIELYETHRLVEVASIIGVGKNRLSAAFKAAGVKIRGKGGRTRKRKGPPPPPHPVPVGPPREPKASAELIAAAALSEAELKLVDWCVEALRGFEDDMVGRLRKAKRLERTRYRNQHSARRHFDSPEEVLTRAGIGWRRQVTLMSIAVAKAHEAGLCLAYNTLSPLRRQIEAEREESA